MTKRHRPYGLDPKEEMGWDKEEEERERQEDLKAFESPD